MFNLKTVKGGKVAYIFDKSHADIAIKMAPVVMAQALGITPKNVPQLQEPKKESGLAELKERVEGVKLNPVSLGKVEDKPKRMSKQELADEIARMTKRIETTFKLPRRKMWHVIYEKFTQKTGVNISKVKKTAKYSHNKSASSYCTLVDQGYGYVLVEIIRDLYDKCASRI